jgi:Zn-dependent peptidase ImmA (M78 family)
MPVLVKDAARTAAQRLLDKHWDEQLPVNPVAIARALNIDVSFGRLEDLSGVIVHNGDSTKIVIADDENVERQLFTCAHEIGHFVERRDSDDNEYSFSEPRNDVDKRGGEWSLHEFYADEFAGNLLMPEKLFLHWHSISPSIAALAEVFGVSRPAVQARLRSLRRDKLLPMV